MGHKAKYSQKRRRKQANHTVPILCAISGILLAVVLLMLFFRPKAQELPKQPTVIPETAETSTPTQIPATEETVQTIPTEDTAPVETQPEILPYFSDMAAQNPDMVGWIKIEGTKLDYPLMYTPEEPEKYLHKDFDGGFSVGGLPFIDEKCSLNPVSDNLLIYGHNMENGTMFRTLMGYDQQTFWEQHPVIHLSTLYEEKTYEIIAAVYDRIYYKSEDCFKFYQFINAENEEEFQEAVTYFKEHALYDTGVTAEYGDKLITLVTCAYHVDNGRFLVVAKELRKE